MSYADVAATNTSGPQPTPDPALYTTGTGPVAPVADDTSKVNLVPSGFKEHPATTTSEARREIDEAEEEVRRALQGGKRKGKEEGVYLWEITKKYVGRPGVAGGLLGVVNLGLLFGAARSFYTRPSLRSDYRTIVSTAAGALAILGLEGYAAEQYAQTERGKQEAEHAKREGTLIYRHAQEALLRPGVLGGLVGLVNAGIVSAVGYFSWKNWDKPTWDTRVVSAVSVGLLTLWGGEGFLAEQYRQKHK